jgi:iron complex outermembrane receptor protein
VAAFHNRYNGLASLELGESFRDTRLGGTIVPLRSENLTDGFARGIETVVAYSPAAPVLISQSYAYLDLSLEPKGSDLNRGRFLEGSTPRHQLGVRASVDLPVRATFDAQFRLLSAVRQIPQITTGEGVPGYGELDVRLAWAGWRRLELSVIGQNLLHRRRAEFGPVEMRGEIERGVYVKLAWGF